MAEKIKLSQEWKQAFAKGEYQSFSQKVSLYDLLFYKSEGSEHFLRAFLGKDGSNTFKGLKLEHNIIALDTSYITKTDWHCSYRAAQTDEETGPIKKMKIEFALPSFDRRAKPLFVTTSNAAVLAGETLSKSTLSMLAPAKLDKADYFYTLQEKSGLDYAPGIKVYSKEAVQNLIYADSFDSSPTFAVGPEVASKQLYKNTVADFFLCEENIDFERKFLSDSISLKAYSSIAVNFSSSFWKELFFEYFSFEKNGYNIATITNDGSSVKLDGFIAYLLKSCYILIKAPFYADYVDYKDFGQQLSQSADVVHRNMMVSASADFERFDSLQDDSIDSSVSTRPYLPTTVPSIDRFASQILEDTTLEKVIESAKSESSEIGALQTQTFESSATAQRSSTSKKDTSTLAPLWFDPDSRSEASDYNDTPTMMPKNGNLYVDGRIISRSIDELWEAIKRLESGRDSDENIDSSSEIGYPTSVSKERTANVDTRPKMKKLKFKTDYGERVGDPTYITYQDASVLQFNVKEWVSDPEKIRYNLIDEIKKMYGWDYNVEDSLVSVSRALEAVGALKELSPAANPYTLRELEALLRGLQYNLAYLVVYSQKHFVRAGKLGDIRNAGLYSEAKGSLYQLHRDFINDGKSDTQYNGEQSLGILTENAFGASQDKIPSKSVYMSANGTWQAVSQFINLRVRDDEDF